MLAYHVHAARAERATQPADGRGLQKLREHQTERVEYAHEQEHERHRDLDTRLVTDDIPHPEPLIDIDDAVVQRAREAAVTLLIGDVVVDETLIAFAMPGRRQLCPVLQPHAIGASRSLKLPTFALLRTQLVLPPLGSSSASVQPQGMNRFSGKSKPLLFRS